MTKPMMDPGVLLEKSADADLPGETIGFAAEPLMELEVGAGSRCAWTIAASWCRAA